MSAIAEIIAGSLIQLGEFLGIFFEHKKQSGIPLRLHNTLSGTKESFTTLERGVVKMYNCGPTVYGPQHIGNLSMFVFTDILRRTLEYAGFRVKQVINITDFGHLTSDADEGDDKMMRGLKREGLTPSLENMRTLAEKYANVFLKDIRTLNIETAETQFPHASDYISQQITMIQTLEKKGFAYRGKGLPGQSGVYFDTSKFPDYGKLGNIKLEALKEGVRVAVNEEKRNPTDFLLWKSDQKIGWDSPWGKGFPGWHIECSAMIRDTLGDQIDIHTGGIEHIPVHHNNEIAQSEATTGKKPFVRFWLHRAHLQLEGGKMAKSEGNVVYLADILEKGFHPMSFRYLLLGAHYRSPSSFTWEALEAAQSAFLKLRRLVDTLPSGGRAPTDYKNRFVERINDDLDTPGALAIVWEMVKDKGLAPKNLRAGLLDFDRVLGLGLEEEDVQARELYEKEFGVEVSTADIPMRIQNLLAERETARAEKRWNDADAARKKIEHAGYVIKDTADGPRIVKRKGV
ncbi:MAG: cysteine--tRNA ligase [Patescibacteria group bacterium]